MMGPVKPVSTSAEQRNNGPKRGGAVTGGRAAAAIVGGNSDDMPGPNPPLQGAAMTPAAPLTGGGEQQSQGQGDGTYQPRYLSTFSTRIGRRSGATETGGASSSQQSAQVPAAGDGQQQPSPPPIAPKPFAREWPPQPPAETETATGRGSPQIGTISRTQGPSVSAAIKRWEQRSRAGESETSSGGRSTGAKTKSAAQRAAEGLEQRHKTDDSRTGRGGGASSSRRASSPVGRAQQRPGGGSQQSIISSVRVTQRRTPPSSDGQGDQSSPGAVTHSPVRQPTTQTGASTSAGQQRGRSAARPQDPQGRGRAADTQSPARAPAVVAAGGHPPPPPPPPGGNGRRPQPPVGDARDRAMPDGSQRPQRPAVDHVPSVSAESASNVGATLFRALAFEGANQSLARIGRVPLLDLYAPARNRNPSPPLHSAVNIQLNDEARLIHASHIDPQTIAAQGPLSHGNPAELAVTLAAVLDHSVDSIVNLAGYIEAANPDLQPSYWPPLGATAQCTLGDRVIDVTTQRVDQQDGYKGNYSAPSKG